MKTKTKKEVFDRQVDAYEAWYEKYPEVYASELEAIRAHFARLPESLRGIEVGLGTGRFAAPLGIKEGVEPSVPMGDKARKRGIEVMESRAEQLPYSALQFDFVLFVTICFLDNPKRAFEEAHRVLKPGGALIVAFLPEDRTIARSYAAKGPWSDFYSEARFYTVDRIADLLKETGFKKPEYNQTLFGELDAIGQVQLPEPGNDRGSFVVVSALKP